ncbi:hypothetical protein OSTOST_17425 [Ostertagia ostertagi]
MFGYKGREWCQQHLEIVQTSNVSEARGLIVDMLANRDLPPNVSSCLRAVASLLNPHTIRHFDPHVTRVLFTRASYGDQILKNLN